MWLISNDVVVFYGASYGQQSSERTGGNTATVELEPSGRRWVAYGHIVNITSYPRTGVNLQLRRLGASYGVIKYNRSGRDDPHWSDTGA